MNPTTTRTVTAHQPRTFSWPGGFDRIPHHDWVGSPIDRLGLEYDAVGRHSWYENLEPIVSQALSALDEGDVLIDYSGGTGLLARRILAGVACPVGLVNVDPSAKFLRVALENFRDDERVAFRLLEWMKDEKRLERLDEALGRFTPELGATVLTSANAIHLYSDLEGTLDSWARTLRAGAMVFACSGNILNPNSRPGDWIIDSTVAKVNEIAIDLVQREPAFEEYREALEDGPGMEAHARYRDKVFVPPRPLDLYLSALTDAGFSVLHTFNLRIDARVRDWCEFLQTYHDGALGWVGGSPKVVGREPSDSALKDRKFLIEYSLEKLFSRQGSFPCDWTYITCRRP